MSEINLNQFKKDVGISMAADGFIKNNFYKLYHSIKKEYEKSFYKNKSFYNKKVSITVEFFYFIMLSISFISFNFIVFVILIILGVIFRKRYYIIFGRFTKEGRIRNLQWEAFKKYISDFSEIKKHPPRSIVLWDAYLVYATAFNIAKKVSKNIKILNPVDSTNNTNLINYSSFIVSSSFLQLNSIPLSPSAGSGSGLSGFSGFGGGGFGGGGAGAR